MDVLPRVTSIKVSAVLGVLVEYGGRNLKTRAENPSLVLLYFMGVRISAKESCTVCVCNATR